MYVTQIRQAATSLGYEEPQILEVFKNTLPTKLYWILFPIEDQRQAVETAKRILTKEKLDKQLTGQASTSPFMSIREGASRKVSFDTRDELGDKLDKLTVMLGRLAAQDSNEKRPFKPQIYQSRGRGQNRGYSQTNYQNRNRFSNRSSSTDRGHFSKATVDLDLSIVIEGTILEIVLGYMEDKIAEGSIGMIIIGMMVRGRDRQRERSSLGKYSNNRTRSTSNSRLRSGSRASTNRDRIRCYNCREYDHFARECPTSREERD